MPDEQARPLVFDLTARSQNAGREGGDSGSGLEPRRESLRDAAQSLAELARSASIDPVLEDLLAGSPLREHFVQSQEAMAREKREARERDAAALTALHGIHSQLATLTDAIAAHDRLLKQHDEELVALRSGAPGRPSSMHLILTEFQERIRGRRVESTLAEQARLLLAWLIEQHPTAARPTTKTVANRIRQAYRRAMATPPTEPPRRTSQRGR